MVALPESVEDVRALVLSVIARNANQATWEAIHAKAQAATGSVEKTSLYELLGIPRDPALAQRALDLAGLAWARHTYGTVSVGPGWANAAVVMFWLVAALALAGALAGAGRGLPAYVVAAPVLLYLSVVFLAFETPRYRTAIDPFIVMLAAAALVTGTEALRRRRSARA